MMNYLWAGLIVSSLAFALWSDGRDASADRYANGRPLPATLELPPPATDAATPRQPVVVAFDPDTLQSHFARGPLSKAETDLLRQSGTLLRDGSRVELQIVSGGLPAPLDAIRRFSDEENKTLRAEVIGLPLDAPPGAYAVTLRLPAVRFVKLRAITNAAFEFSKTAVTLALGFVGIFALWMGLMKIAEASGLVQVFVVLVQPFLRLLFPRVPKGHPAFGMIAMNLAANMLGLGNAATPMGLKAMEELQKLNPKPDTATDPMVMLLAVNTAGVQLLPSATLVAVMGLSSMQVFLPILVVTAMSLVIAVIATKLLGRLPGVRATDPNAGGHQSEGTVQA